LDGLRDARERAFQTDVDSLAVVIGHAAVKNSRESHRLVCVYNEVPLTAGRSRGEISDVLLHFETRAPQRRLGSKINQSIKIYLFVQKCNTHWTGHQGRMQPPLTGAHKTKLVRATDVNT